MKNYPEEVKALVDLGWRVQSSFWFACGGEGLGYGDFTLVKEGEKPMTVTFRNMPYEA